MLRPLSPSLAPPSGLRGLDDGPHLARDERRVAVVRERLDPKVVQIVADVERAERQHLALRSARRKPRPRARATLPTACDPMTPVAQSSRPEMTAVLDTALTASSPGSTTSSLMARLESALLAVALVGIASRAAACGVSATGVASCSLAEHQESERSRWAVGRGGVVHPRRRFASATRCAPTKRAAPFLAS